MDFLNRIGQLNIPNGLAGPPGAAGINGAGWNSGSGAPSGAPPTDIKFYLDITTGEVSEWNGSSWVQIIQTIFGTNGNVWFDGAGAPGVISGAVINDFYLDTTNGVIYQYDGVTWGSPILTIQGTPGTNGVNGTGLLGSAYSIASVTQTTTGNVVFAGFEIAVNGLQAFPTLGSVVKVTGVFKSNYSLTALGGATSGQIYFTPRIINQNTSAIYDILVDSIDQNTTSPLNSAKQMLGVNAVNSNSTHGYSATSGSGFEYSNSGLPNVALSGGGFNIFPFAHTKYVLTAIRASATSVIVSVDWTTTTRYGSYTGFYSPSFINTLDFSSSGGIAFNVQAYVDVPVNNPIVIDPIYHIVEKSIL